MNRFEGIKKVKLSLKRTDYLRGRKGKKAGRQLLWRIAISILLVLFALALKATGFDVGELLKQDYITMYAKS